MNQTDLKSLWGTPSSRSKKVRSRPTSQKSVHSLPTKRIHRYNTSTFRPKGKIQIDEETYVKYDYTDPAHPKSKLVEKKSVGHPKMTTPNPLPSYPVFRGFLSGVPSCSSPGLTRNDFFYIEDIDQLCCWQQDTFELVS